MADKELNGKENTSESVSLEVALQYVKDLSFENPKPLEYLQGKNSQFDTSLNVDVQPRAINDDTFEIILTLKIHVQSETNTVYLLDIQYAGIFKISGAKEELLKLILFIECPRLLFPYARAVVGRITQESGFPSLDLKPIDFSTVLRHRLEQEEKHRNKDEKVASSKKEDKKDKE